MGTNAETEIRDWEAALWLDLPSGAYVGMGYDEPEPASSYALAA